MHTFKSPILEFTDFYKTVFLIAYSVFKSYLFFDLLLSFFSLSLYILQLFHLFIYSFNLLISFSKFIFIFFHSLQLIIVFLFSTFFPRTLYIFSLYFYPSFTFFLPSFTLVLHIIYLPLQDRFLQQTIRIKRIKVKIF